MPNKIDLTGQRFGRLVVVEEAGANKGGRILWRCKCDCGKISVVVGYNLRSGNTKSCGCYNKETLSKVAKKRRSLPDEAYELSNCGRDIKYLTNTYVRICLKKQGFTKFTPEMIEMKREQLKIYRELKKYKEALKNAV